MIKITCCRDCPDRHMGCHSICEKYIAERSAHKKTGENVLRDYNAAKSKNIFHKKNISKRR